MSTSSAPWFHTLGPALTVQVGPDATGKPQALPTAEVLRGRATVGIYFSADWCIPCASFTPLLSKFYLARRHLGPDRQAFEVVLVSWCRSDIDTSNYFATMPWTAMAHADSMGPRGHALMSRLGVTTIPALVLLNETGSIICGDARHRLVGDPTGSLFPWGPASQLPPDPRLAPPLSRPPGCPPGFGSAPTSAPGSTEGTRRTQPLKKPTPASLESPQVVCHGKGAISFKLNPDQDRIDAAALLRKTSIRQSEKTSYMFTDEQRAGLAAASSTARPLGPLQHKSNTALPYNTCTPP